MEFKELVLARFNAKKFNGKKVDDEKLNELFDIIRFAPSADNLQPWKIKVISDPGDKGKAHACHHAIQPWNVGHVLTPAGFLRRYGPGSWHWNKLEEAALKAAGFPEEEMIKHMAAGGENDRSAGSHEEKLNRSQWDVFLAVGCNAVNGAKSLGFRFIADGRVSTAKELWPVNWSYLQT